MDNNYLLASDALPKFAYSIGLGSHEIWFQRCTWCGSAQLRYVNLCRVCAGEDLSWERSSGLGQVTAIRSTSSKAHYPPVFSLIQLDDGPQVAGWVVGESWHELQPGSRVHFSLNDDATAHPVFELTTRRRTPRR
jgi:uncharacterized OB-fold protein